MKLPSSTMGFARVSFPLIQAGEGVWQCRYSCILRAPKLRPPIWIQAFQIVKWHSSFLREAGSMARFLLGLKKCLFLPSLITLSLLTLTPSPSYFLHLRPPPCCLPSLPTFPCTALDCLSLSLSLILRLKVLFSPTTGSSDCPPSSSPAIALVPPPPTPFFPWVILRRGNTITGCEIKYITALRIKVFHRQLLIHIKL